MELIKKLIANNLLLFGIGLGMFCAWLYPDPGIWLASIGISNFLVVIIFFFQGALLDGSVFSRVGTLVLTFGWGLLISQALGPLLGYTMIRLISWTPDYQVGFILTCCMAPTLVSGVVMAVRAGGDHTSALLLAAGINLLATLLIPLNLGWTLGAIVRLDTWSLFIKLFCLVVLPVAAGQFFRYRKQNLIGKARGIFQDLPIAAFSMIIYLAFSMQAGHWKKIVPADLAVLVPSSVLIHSLLLVIGYFGGRYLLKIHEADNRSVAVVCSQKTIPLAIVVWSDVFARQYPLAMLAPLVFHFSQTIIDGILVSLWGKRGIEKHASIMTQ